MSGLNPASPLRRLLDAPVRPGRVEWIGLRRARRAPLEPVDTAVLDPAGGLGGDHARGPRRQLTLIERADLAAIADYLGLPGVEPGDLRRNIVVTGINLHALRGAHVRLGGAVIAITGECHPCSRMEERFGGGGYNAVRGRGGVTAQVIRGGTVRRGDAVERLGPSG